MRDNWLAFRDEIETLAQRYSRDASQISIMAVSKTRSIHEIQEAQDAGLMLFGENSVDEALGKFWELNTRDFPLYMIGHLQSRKASGIGTRFAGVHSVDSVKLAHRLSRHRSEINAPLEILLQVNTSGEASKSGFRDRSIFQEAVDEIRLLPNLVLKGVMTMAPFVDDEVILRKCFAACRNWSEDIIGMIEGVPIISMGMSSDYQWAIAEGSTMLRIGTALFGRKN